MIEEHKCNIEHYDFDSLLPNTLNENYFVNHLWPTVYLLSNDKIKEAYIGETTDAYSRMQTHLKNEKKNKLTSIHLITSEQFNKSAALDIESNLIKYISGDGIYKLLNGNLGLANHNYYQKKEVYWGVFKSIWNKLRSEGLVKHSLKHIDNSDLFKYSPYKTLTREQKKGLYIIINNLLDDNIENYIIEGGAGTGKTILAVFLFKLINSDNSDFNFKEFGVDESEFTILIQKVKNKYPNPKMGLVIPMASFRSTLKKVFRNIKGLSAKMVIGPAEVSKSQYDILLIDESHRLRQRVNLGAYFGAFDKACLALNLDKNVCSELDWVVQQSKKTILFYDENQSIKPSDTKKEDFDKLKDLTSTKIGKLSSQFRVKGGNSYIDYVNNLLGNKMPINNSLYSHKDYEFKLFDSIEELTSQIKLRDNEFGLSRLIAGFSWKWISKNDKEKFDININGFELQWNSTSNDWINTSNSVNEVGCIHTTQGYDLNYAGIIFGNEISFDKDKNEIIIKEENYFDKNGKQSIKDPEQLKSYILNIYKTILLRGIKGTYIYACDKELRDYLSKYVPLVLAKDAKKEIEYIPHEEVIPFVNSIPLYDLKVAAGSFGQVQQIDDIKWLKLPAKYKYSKELFACKVIGESMNKIIQNGSICLFRKYTGGSRNGLITLVEHSNYNDIDFGSSYTVKEYQSSKVSMNELWEHKSIILKPLSTDTFYQELLLENVEEDNLKVIGIFECVL
jgi:DUF2075 family protein/predicted GIY-YIG superfamily endonuclease